jgi:hypothetical protein
MLGQTTFFKKKEKIALDLLWFFTEFCGWAVKDMEKGRDGNL